MKYTNIIVLVYLLFSSYRGTRSLSDVTLEILTQDKLYESAQFTSKCVVKLNPPCSDTQIDYIVYEKLYGDVWEEACFVFNNESVRTETLPDGYTLGDRARVDYYKGEYTVHFYNVILKDSGEWRCKVDSCTGGSYHSNEIHFYVSTKVMSDDLRITADPPSYILLGSPSTFTCVSDRVHPKLDLYWSLKGADIDNTTTTSQPNGAAWTLSNTNLFTFFNQENKDIKCILEKTEEPFTWKVENNLSNIKEIAPAVIIDSHISPQTPSLGDDLTMKCTGSGTGKQVQWKRRGSDIGDELFIETSREIPGNFPYGETTSREVTMTWIPPDDNVGCETIDKHDGTYYCEATAEQGPAAISQDYEVSVHYSPRLVNGLNTTFNQTVGDVVTMSCDVVCANPVNVYYLWTSENGREGLDQNVPMISFNVEAGDLNDTFRCYVNNSEGSISRKFNIVQIDAASTTEAMTTTTSTSSIITTDSGQPSTGLDFSAGIAIGLTIGIIICGMLFAGFLFFHRKYFIKPKDDNINQNDAIAVYEHHNSTTYEQVNDIRNKSIHDNNMIDYDTIEQMKYEQLHLSTPENVHISTYEELNGSAR